MLHYTPTPTQEIKDPILEQAGVRLLVKREDLNHTFISGNKWWKLKYNLEEALLRQHKTVLTFGGSYSNHIYATAAASQELKLRSIGIIRGEETLPLNATLTFAEQCGMKLHYIDRISYRNKNSEDFINQLHHQFGEFYLIPEGGTNAQAVKGCREFAQHYIKTIQADYICLAVGTGGTMAGLIEGLQGEKEIIGFSVLKNGEFLNNEIEKLLQNSYSNWKLETSYHHGGYAKTTQELMKFISEMNDKNNLPLDHVYTGKLIFGIMDYVKKNKFKSNSIILALHSGGLQGIRNQ